MIQFTVILMHCIQLFAVNIVTMSTLVHLLATGAKIIILNVEQQLTPCHHPISRYSSSHQLRGPSSRWFRWVHHHSHIILLLLIVFSLSPPLLSSLPQAAYALGCEKQCILCIQDLPSVVVIDGESVRIQLNYFSCYQLLVHSIFHTLLNPFFMLALGTSNFLFFTLPDQSSRVSLQSPRPLSCFFFSLPHSNSHC